jgi:hypothetical protein
VYIRPELFNHLNTETLAEYRNQSHINLPGQLEMTNHLVGAIKPPEVVKKTYQK